MSGQGEKLRFISVAFDHPYLTSSLLLLQVDQLHMQMDQLQMEPLLRQDDEDDDHDDFELLLRIAEWQSNVEPLLMGSQMIEAVPTKQRRRKCRERAHGTQGEWRPPRDSRATLRGIGCGRRE